MYVLNFSTYVCINIKSFSHTSKNTYTNSYYMKNVIHTLLHNGTMFICSKFINVMLVYTYVCINVSAYVYVKKLMSNNVNTKQKHKLYIKILTKNYKWTFYNYQKKKDIYFHTYICMYIFKQKYHWILYKNYLFHSHPKKYLCIVNMTHINSLTWNK